VPAEEAIDADAQIAAMRESSRKLTGMAEEPLPAFRSPQERKDAEAWRAFLSRAGHQLEALASEWEQARVTDRSGERSGTAAAGGSQAALMNASHEMQEMNQGFNLQYLNLQQKIQAENRAYTALSNVMKTKHDTVKNAIGSAR
jgi:hypothetical protein